MLETTKKDGWCKKCAHGDECTLHAPTYVPGDDVSLTEDKPVTPDCFQQQEKIFRIPICDGQCRQGDHVISRF